MNRPVTVLAMSAHTHRILFTPSLLGELAAVADLNPRTLVTGFADPAVQTALAQAEVLFTSWGCPPITLAELARMPHLRAVVHCAGSVKHHITPAVWDRGIAVTSAAHANAIPVAEYTLAAILFASKRILDLARAFRLAQAEVSIPDTFPEVGNYGRTVGLIGASRIGRRVAELLRPFDMRVLMHDPYLAKAEALELGVELTDLDRLIAGSDIVSIHAPELPETRHMFDQRRIALLRDGATLINTARGSLVDTDALVEHLITGRLNAILDVTDPEPPVAGSPLYHLPNVLLTPHVAGSVGNELRRMVRAGISEVHQYAQGKPFIHAIAPATLAVIA